MNKIIKNQRGYAIVIVMFLLIVGTGILLLSNKENLLFTKISGFFNRSKQVQSVAESGLLLAELDLKTLSANVLLDDYSAVDTFTDLPGESSQLPIDQGLHVYNVNPGSRIITPRIAKSEGNIDLEVTYFPQDPCEGTCADADEYNEKMPKFFTIVSQATHNDTGEIFTIESRVQVRLENYSEISFGITGVGDYPKDPYRYYFIPSVYGRTHINIPDNKIRFRYGGGLIKTGVSEPTHDGASNVHTFLGPVTFEDPTERDHGDEDNVPFERDGKYFGEWDVSLKPVLEFTKGLDYPVNLVAAPGDDGYKAELDPSTTEYFDKLEGAANSGAGTNLSGTSGACQLNSVTGRSEVNICLKGNGSQVLRYDCNDVDSDAGEFFMQPAVDRPIKADDPSIATEIATFPDRYTGERADVFGGTTTNSTGSFAFDGVIFCREAGCDCNIHFKGLYDGSATLAADNIIIEGDIISNDPDPVNSINTLGAIAKKNIVIPQGIPQAANTAPTNGGDSNHGRTDITSSTSPINRCTSPSSACTPDTLAESYLGITNFIAHDGTDYVDRDFGNEHYINAATWIDIDTHGHSTDYYNSPMALDLDGNFIAGEHVVIEGIFNPDDTYGDDTGSVILTCENPPTCDEYAYREPMVEFEDDGVTRQTDNPLYVETAPDVYEFVEVGGVDVQPVFYADGVVGGGWIHPAHTNGVFNMKEEMPRVANEMLHVFGSLSSKFFFTNASASHSHSVGFKTKVISSDPRAGTFNPPGFPFTLNIVYDELYQKSRMGKSTLLP